MELIERPKEVSKSESAVRTDKNDQEYTQNQLTNIYDYLDKFASAFNQVSVLDQVYPIGSIYISVNNTNPSTFIGGEWEKLSSNYYLMASDNGGGATSSSNTRDISHQHTLNTTNNIQHNIGTGAYSGFFYTATNESTVKTNQKLVNIGGSTSLNIQPASIAVCMWKRTK